MSYTEIYKWLEFQQFKLVLLTTYEHYAINLTLNWLILKAEFISYLHKYYEQVIIILLRMITYDN